MNRSPRPWPLLAVALLATGVLGSCAGTVAAHYTVTGMLPLAPSGAVPEYQAELRVSDAVAPAWSEQAGYSDLSYTSADY
ncbi:hypothetical protein K9B35_12720 [Sphingomonas sp. R647]|uniref:hypothetical protein n=1 Tax=Sphingomonas sp. R647 TaxID=2875233 RepID=UPI001CD6FE0B|nr:hypothetical protein [Sphingomonas sp. R647]MCA1198832.1 hypothetical protein [Sphingomonas sp. R647]